MSRVKAFENIKKHPLLRKIYEKMNANERAFIQNFLSKTEDLSKDEFASKVNRLGVDVDAEFSNLRRKSDVWALLIETNSSLGDLKNGNKK